LILPKLKELFSNIETNDSRTENKELRKKGIYKEMERKRER